MKRTTIIYYSVVQTRFLDGQLLGSPIRAARIAKCGVYAGVKVTSPEEAKRAVAQNNEPPVHCFEVHVRKDEV